MKNKKKISKIIGGIIGVSAICCIIPACVVSCGSSSSSSSNSSSNNTSSSTSSSSTSSAQNATLLQINATSTSTLTPISVADLMDAIGESVSANTLEMMSQSMVIYQTTADASNTYTINIDNVPQGKNLTYSWYSINEVETNEALQNGEPQMDISSNDNINYVDDFINYGGTLLNNSKSTYTYSGANSGMGNVFVCKITDGNQTYYSQIIWLESATTKDQNINNNNSQSTGYGNDPLSVAGTTCTIKLENSNIKPSTTNANTYIIPQGTKANFSLSVGNLSYKDFANYQAYEVEWSVSNSNNNNISSVYLPLYKASSWNYSVELPVGINNITYNILYDGNMVSSNQSTTNYEVSGIQIQWSNAEVSLGQSDTLNEIGGYTPYSTATYYWQQSTDGGKTWTNIPKETGTIQDATQISNQTIPSITINDITNSTDKYRLELINTTNPSQILYSNVLTSNDTLITSNLTFSNNDYQSEMTSKTWGSAIIPTSENQFYLTVSLNQLGKNITNTINLKNVSGTITVNYLVSEASNAYYSGNDPFTLNVSDLSQYLQTNNTLKIPVNITNIVQNLNNINQAINQNGNLQYSLNWYEPCTISFSFNQEKINIPTSNTISATFETAAINVTSNDTEINGVYYVPWDKTISLTSANSMLSFSANAQLQYQWQVSTDEKNWQSLENGSGTTYSGSNNYNQLYYRLKITSLQGSDVVIYSNVIEISSAVPSATLEASNQTDQITVDSNQATVNLSMNQYNAPITSSNDVQVVYQSYGSASDSWQDLTKPQNYSSTTSTYTFTNLVSGTNKIRAEYIFMGKIVQYSNTVTITELVPTISPVNNSNSPDNANNYISNSGSTYTYIAGSVVQLNINQDGLFNKDIIDGYSINSIAWYEKNNNGALVDYTTTYSTGDYIGYAFRATSPSAQYDAVISYENNNTGAVGNFTTNPITINTVDNGTTANIELSNINALQNWYSTYIGGNLISMIGQYCFLNVTNIFSSEYQNNSYSNFPNLDFSLNVYQDGKSLDLSKSNSSVANWETTWYSEKYTNSIWSDQTVLQNTATLSTATASNYSYNYNSYIESDANGNTSYAIPVRIRCLITEGTTQVYSQWYYIGGEPAINVTNSY